MGGIFLYAYRQQIQTRTLHVVSDRPVQNPIAPKRKNIRPKKKKNLFLELFRSMVTLTFLSAFIVFVHPTVFNSLIKQVFMPTNIKTVAQYNGMNNIENPALKTDVDLYKMANPVTNYIYNDVFNDKVLLTPTLQKKHCEVTTMYHTDEITDLKSQLYTLMKQYPAIKPSIYVWEYDQGRYVDINANKMYSAASIIKLPVLVRLFKSIEANQLTIFDEMTMLEQHRSSGSGNLQYAKAGQNYTMDYLAKIMIQDSDNTSTNMIMSKIGGMKDINVGLRDWGISSTYVRTWLPDLKGSNKTTAADIAKILYNLDNPGFLNINSREYIIDYMSHVKNNRLIQAGLGEGALFIHKTGDIGTMLGDAGIVYAQNGKKYIVVILAERPYNSPQGKDFIVSASKIIYNAIVK